jgi:hypothetical protein
MRSQVTKIHQFQVRHPKLDCRFAKVWRECNWFEKFKSKSNEEMQSDMIKGEMKRMNVELKSRLFQSILTMIFISRNAAHFLHFETLNRTFIRPP